MSRKSNGKLVRKTGNALKDYNPRGPFGGGSRIAQDGRDDLPLDRNCRDLARRLDDALTGIDRVRNVPGPGRYDGGLLALRSKLLLQLRWLVGFVDLVLQRALDPQLGSYDHDDVEN